MPRFLVVLALVFCVRAVSMQSQDHKSTAPEDYLFVWTGDAAHKGNDFLKLSDTYSPHWTGWGAKTQRLVATSGTAPDRLYLLKLDQATGALTIDDAFRGADGKTGFSFADREWLQGWKGTGAPHGAVFSR
jgi:hypothetical protein